MVSSILTTRPLDLVYLVNIRLLFYYPFTALTIIFSHVIWNPLLPTAQKDIALMDVVTGLFGRLDFVSSGLMACNEAGEFAKLARSTVQRSTERAKQHSRSSRHPRTTEQLPSSTPMSSTCNRGLDIDQLEVSFWEADEQAFGIEQFDTVGSVIFDIPASNISAIDRLGVDMEFDEV